MPETSRIHVPRRIVDQTVRFLQQQGRRFCEGVVLWAVRSDNPARVVEAIIPDQEPIPATEGACVVLPLPFRERLTRELHERGLYIAIQVHSHPGEAFHSDTDDRYPVIHHRGAISIVVPYFARYGMPIEDLAVFMLEAWPTWIELDEAEKIAALELGA